MASLGRQPLSVLLITTILAGSVMVYEAFAPNAMIPIKDDVPTLGYGTTVHPNGVPVKMGETITRQKASEYLQHDLDKFKQGMAKCVTAPLHTYEFNAYMSLVYNIGSGAFCASSIPFKLNQGDYLAACNTILQFNKVKDLSKPKVRNAKTGKMQFQYKIIRGLDNRRKAEHKTCVGGSVNA
jgi:lysozyme